MKAGLAGLLTLVFAGASAQAQCCPGVVYGKVIDPTGAPIPGAQVTVECKPQIQKLTAVTDAKGKYATAQMPYGPCDVVIAARGFEAFHTSVMGEIDQSPVVNAKLEIAKLFDDGLGSASEPLILNPRPVPVSPLSSDPAPLQAVPPAFVPVSDAAHRDWEFGAFGQGGVGLEDRTNFGFFSLGARAGHMLSGPIFSGVLQGVPEYAVEVLPVWQSYTPKFPQLKCPAGATLASQCYGPVTAGGTYRGVSITPIVLRWNFTHGERFMPWVQAAGGVVYTTRKYPGVGNLNAADATQTGPNADTSVWNFTPQGGVGVHYFTRDKRSVDAAVNAVHISSASLGDKNPGVNVSLMFSVGYTWWK